MIKNINIGSRGIILNDQNEVLLIKKKNKDEYELIGGKIEFMEKVEETFIRETREETGIEIEVIRSVGYDEYVDHENMEHWIGFGFHGRLVSGEAKVIEPEKHDEVRWFKVHDIPENVSPQVKRIVAALSDI